MMKKKVKLKGMYKLPIAHSTVIKERLNHLLDNAYTTHEEESQYVTKTLGKISTKLVSGL